MSSYQQAFDELEIQIAFEKYSAEKANCSYEELKAQLDQSEKTFKFRYLPNSPRHTNWLLWKAAWLSSKKAYNFSPTNTTHITVPTALSDEKAVLQANKEFEETEYFLTTEFQKMNQVEFEEFRAKWISAKALQLQAQYKQALMYAML